MAVSVQWFDEEKTLLKYEFIGIWTWEEFYPVLDEAHAMANSVAHRVDAICDFRSTTSLPENALANLKKITEKAPPNSGLSVFVTTSRFLTLMYDTAVKFYPKTKQFFVVAPTMDEAHACIREARTRDTGK